VVRYTGLAWKGAQIGFAISAALYLGAGAAGSSGFGRGPSPSRAVFARLAEQAEQAPRPLVRGLDGWLFLGSELRHLGLGRFWGPRALEVSRAVKPEWADPLPVILDLKDQLDRAGIEFLFVPVPAKAALYPDQVPGLADADPSLRWDADDAAFYEVLRGQGVEVLDLVPEFHRVRAADDRPLYCRQDTHWAGPAVERTASLIGAHLRGGKSLGNPPTEQFETERRPVEIVGDLWRMLDDESAPKETLILEFVGRRTEVGLEPIEPWRESPVLLLGDSHGLVFHAGADMHARGAGLADHLAKELGFPVDLVAVRGSGATPSRINLLRRQDDLEGKKVVIWCLSVREFTEGAQGWRLLPILR
jgi:alginate O-acetyltransferase complex protein AlgJ